MDGLPHGGEEKVICPYNPCHHIAKKRMDRHLHLCRKNYPSTNIVTCDFNVLHRCPEPEMAYHYERCPDVRHVELNIFQEENGPSAGDKYPIHKLDVPTDPSWDVDPPHPTYDPQQHCAQRAVLRKLDVEPPSKRRDFRLEERQRLQEAAKAQDQIKPNHTNNRTPTKNKPGGRKTNDELFARMPDISEKEAMALESVRDIRGDVFGMLNKGSRKVFTSK